MSEAHRLPALRRRHAMALLSAGALWPTAAAEEASVEQVRSFTIATGSLGATYYPVGGLIADLLTAPPGGLPCRPDEVCGVANMVAVAQTSDGSVANVNALAQGIVDSAFCQADVAYQAWRGEGPFTDRPMPDLRVIASLYPEVAQLVVLTGDLPSRLRIGIGAAESGTKVAAERLLHGFGFDDAETERLPLNPGPAIDSMARGELDGFLTVAGLPTAAVTEALTHLDARLVGVAPAQARTFLRERSFWRLHTIPGGLYPGQPTPLRTLAVAALWVVDAAMDDDLVTELLTTLWTPAAAPILAAGHPVGAHIGLATALDGISLPLHPAAAAYYREARLIAAEGDDVLPAEAAPPRSPVDFDDRQ